MTTPKPPPRPPSPAAPHAAARHAPQATARPAAAAARPAPAVAFDLDHVPTWSTPVADTLLDLLASHHRLDAARAVLIAPARTGYLAARLAVTLPRDARIMAVDTSKDMLELARKRLASAPQQVFYSVQSLQKLTYAERVFNAVFCDHALLTRGDLRLAGRELTRVLKPDGLLALAIPYADTLRCFPDMLYEAALRRDMPDALQSIQNLLAALPTPATLPAALREAGLEPLAIRAATFTLSFPDAEDLLFSPFVEHLYLPRWLATCTHDAQREVLFFDALHALNTYFSGVPITAPAAVACVIARRSA